MNGRVFIGTMVVLAAYLAGHALAQVPVAPSHPSCAGVWTPSDPEASDSKFGVGLTLIPGQGRLDIEQRADRLTVTMTIPEKQLARMLAASGRFYPAAIYNLPESDGRPGSDYRQQTQARWVDDRLVIPNPWPGLARPTTQTYSLDGNRLKIQTHSDMGNGRQSDVTEWFTKAK